MSKDTEPTPIPDVLKRYARDPLPEKYTVEILEDLHAVLDEYIVELLQGRGSEKPEEALIKEWDDAHVQHVEDRRAELAEIYGAVLPFDYVAANIKMAYLVNEGHEAFQQGSVPDGVVEVVQEFVEILTDGYTIESKKNDSA